jgi:hypothetical protein
VPLSDYVQNPGHWEHCRPPLPDIPKWRPIPILGIARKIEEGDEPVELNTIEEIERAIDALPPQQLAQLYAWLDEHRPLSPPSGRGEQTVFEQGLGLFGSPADAALMDEVVHIAYEERRRPSPPSTVL